LIVDLFIYRSGYDYRQRGPKPFEDLEELIVAIADKHPPFDEIVDWFKTRLRRREKHGSGKAKHA
jgi:hypothetical protein